MKYVFVLFMLPLFVLSCKDEKAISMRLDSPPLKNEQLIKRKLSPSFNAYWYNGTAEITSYELEQERYGVIRNGKVVTVFVTESFNPLLQVKADNATKASTPILKLNLTKKFNTGIYPYSVMTSTFQPVEVQQHPLKITHSTQEWCGQVFMQLNNRKKFDISSFSYFESESDQQVSIEKTWLEDELFTTIRLNPADLPEGELNMLPSFEYLRLRHKNIEPLSAIGTIKMGDSISSYQLKYTNEKRSLKIYFTTAFPFQIKGWEEIHANGLMTKATAIKTINSPYWQQNGPAFDKLRDTLQLNY